MSFHQHTTAICESNTIGDQTSVDAYSVISKTARLGKHCKIGCFSHIKDKCDIGNQTSIGSNCVIAEKVQIEEDCKLGDNVSILAGIQIGQGAVIRSGSVVTRHVPPHAIISGNPAEIEYYASENVESLDQSIVTSNKKIDAPLSLDVGRSALWPLPNFDDMRGTLTVSEYEKDLPFKPERSFLVYNVPNNKIRGEHAHKQCDQFLIAVHGTLSILLDDGKARREVQLQSPDQGVYMPAGIWGTQYKFSSDAVLLVFASRPYENDDYLRTYADFLNYINQNDA